MLTPTRQYSFDKGGFSLDKGMHRTGLCLAYTIDILWSPELYTHNTCYSVIVLSIIVIAIRTAWVSAHNEVSVVHVGVWGCLGVWVMLEYA